MVADFVAQVLASNLPLENKVQLLEAKQDSDVSALYMALQNGCVTTVKTIVEQVLASDLPVDVKVRLLAAKGVMAYPDCIWLFKTDMQMHWKRLWSGIGIKPAT